MSNSSQINPSNQCMNHHHCGHKTFSWSAVIVGALVGIGISFLLNIFSIAIGLSVFPTTTNGEVTLAIGGFIGVVIGSFVAMFIAGWVSGYLGRGHCKKRNLGVLYGFAAWCLALIVLVFISANLGHFIAAYANFISDPASMVVTGNEVVPMATAQMKSVLVFNFHAASSYIAVNALVVFILFFIGALGACFGGHYGMMTRCSQPCECCPRKM
jgi:MFS family permease